MIVVVERSQTDGERDRVLHPRGANRENSVVASRENEGERERERRRGRDETGTGTARRERERERGWLMTDEALPRTGDAAGSRGVR